MVASKESGTDCDSQSVLEGSGAGDSRRIVRDVSASLDMTKEGIVGHGDMLTVNFPSLLSFRAQSRNLLLCSASAIKFVFASCRSEERRVGKECRWRVAGDD